MKTLPEKEASLLISHGYDYFIRFSGASMTKGLRTGRRLAQHCIPFRFARHQHKPTVMYVDNKNSHYKHRDMAKAGWNDQPVKDERDACSQCGQSDEPCKRHPQWETN